MRPFFMSHDRPFSPGNGTNEPLDQSLVAQAIRRACKTKRGRSVVRERPSKYPESLLSGLDFLFLTERDFPVDPLLLETFRLGLLLFDVRLALDTIPGKGHYL